MHPVLSCLKFAFGVCVYMCMCVYFIEHMQYKIPGPPSTFTTSYAAVQWVTMMYHLKLQQQNPSVACVESSSCVQLLGVCIVTGGQPLHCMGCQKKKKKPGEGQVALCPTDKCTALKYTCLDRQPAGSHCIYRASYWMDRNSNKHLWASF